MNDIERCIQAELYYPALAVALTLPDVCIGLSLADDIFVTRKTYAAFIETYIAEPGPTLGVSGEECYQLRCGVLHRGNAAGSPFLGSTHVVITPPTVRLGLHGFSISAAGGLSAMMLDLVTFCDAMIVATKAWYAANHADPFVQRNLPRLMTWRPNGVHPFVGGQPVLGSGT